MESKRLVEIIEGFSDFYHSYKDFDPPKGLTTIISEYVDTIQCAPGKGIADPEKLYTHEKTKIFVYVLCGYIERDATDILGVYSTKGKANRAKSEYKSRVYDKIDLEEFEIDE